MKYEFPLALALTFFVWGCDEGPGPLVYGAPCTATTACGGGLLCITATTFPGGYCSSDCSATECGMGAICERSSAPPICLAVCDEDSDCRGEYQCWRGACRPRCNFDPASCGTDATCDSTGHCVGRECSRDDECDSGRVCTFGRCLEATPPPDGGGGLANGAACTSDRQCQSTRCLPSDRGGICTGSCSRPTDCFDVVDFEAACAPIARGDAIETLCVRYDPSKAEMAVRCATDNDCAAGTCVDGQCTEACAETSECVLGQICTSIPWNGGNFQGCGYRAETGVIEIPLGDHDVSVNGGTTDLVFATPPDSVSVTLRAQTISGDPIPIAFYDVYDSEDTAIFLLEDVFANRDTPNRWVPTSPWESLSMLIPNATPERVRYVPGRHRFRLFGMERMPGDSGVTRLRVSALVKRAPSGVARSTIDLDIYIVGLSGITAATAPSSTRVQGVLERARALLEPTGISLGEIMYRDITGAESTRLQVIDSVEGVDSELAALLRHSEGVVGNRIALFFVRSINNDTSGTTLGISGGIPGPSLMHGTMNSGIAIAFEAGDAATIGHTVAHEMGHYLGLYHVTERERPCAEGETPTSCAPFGGTDTIGDTTRGDTTNLMHWSLVGSGTNTRLSSGQTFVLQRSAVAH